MAESTVIPTKERRLAALRGALREGSWRGAARMIAAMHPAEIALLIESLPPGAARVVWNFVEPKSKADVPRSSSAKTCARPFIEGMDADEAARPAAEKHGARRPRRTSWATCPKPSCAAREVRWTAGPRSGMKARAAPYERTPPGGLMNTDTVSVRADVTVEVVLALPAHARRTARQDDRLIVVDRNDPYPRTSL
jgi:magnesium transporter